MLQWAHEKLDKVGTKGRSACLLSLPALLSCLLRTSRERVSRALAITQQIPNRLSNRPPFLHFFSPAYHCKHSMTNRAETRTVMSLPSCQTGRLLQLKKQHKNKNRSFLMSSPSDFWIPFTFGPLRFIGRIRVCTSLEDNNVQDCWQLKLIFALLKCCFCFF